MKGNFTIPITIYPFDLLVSINESDKKFAKILKSIKETSKMPDLAESMTLKGCNGVSFTTPRGSSIIRMSHLPIAGDFEAVFSHELLHIVHNTLKFVGMKLTDSSVEAYCYLTDYLTKQFYIEYWKLTGELK
jgi:hypothetical protein